MSAITKLQIASLLLLVSFPCWLLGAGKANPGGPFVSLFGDVVPVTSALLTIWFSLPYTVHRILKIKVSAIALLALATVMLASVAVGVTVFYFSPHARGTALGL